MILPSLRRDAHRALAGDGDAGASLAAGVATARWARGCGDVPSRDSGEPRPSARALVVEARRFGRLPGRFAWGDDGAFGLAVCRAVGSDAALGALVAPLFGVGLFGLQRSERSAALAALPAAYAEPTRDAFARARDRSDLPEVREATQKMASACLQAAIQCRGDARQKACTALARATGGHWCDELAALNHGRATHAGPASDPTELDAFAALWVDWFAPTETERS